MKKRTLSRRDFLKLAGVGTVIVLPSTFGYSLYRSAQGEYPVEGDPYSKNIFTESLDGSVPILLIVNQASSNPFGIYVAEILRAEGLNSFHTADLSNIQPEILEKYDFVILTETPLNATQKDIFTGYVADGGSLLGMKPDDQLSPVFGVEKSEGYISEGYIKTEPGHPASEGIYSSTLQFHGSADLYQLSGAQALAWLYTTRDAASEYPAVTLNSYGKGMAGLWAFDLAKSIAYTRQGNPAYSNQEKDGHPYIRATDMFVDWIDLDRIQIPQADEQQRLFVKLLHALGRDKSPLPRLWYFPGDIKALLVATGDAHPISSSEAIEDVLGRVEARDGHMTIYYSFTLHDDFYRLAQKGRFYATRLPVVGEAISNKFRTPSPYQVDEWRLRGHEFTLHPHVGSGICGGYGVSGTIAFTSQEDGWDTYWQQFTGLGYGPVSQTVRTHCVLWQGWVETARLQASYGIRMSVDYYHVGPLFKRQDGEWAFGYFTGSGLPMKFIDEQGRVIDIYQQLTQLADEQLFSFPEINWVSVSDDTTDEAVAISKSLMDFSLENNMPAAFCVNFHPDPFSYGGRPAEIAGRWLEETLDYAVENGIPIWSAQDWLQFTQVRHDVNILSMDWDDQNLILNFMIEVKNKQENSTITDLSLMIPAEQKEASLRSIEINGTKTDLIEKWTGGIHYFWISISSGIHSVRASYSLGS